MRRGLVIFAAVCGACWCTSAQAQQIVQNLAGNQRSPAFFNLFNPALGTLDSVTIQGVQGLQFGLVRDGLGSLAAVSVADTTSGDLDFTVQDGPSLYGTTPVGLTGYETYDAGSIFGAMLLSGDVDETVTGSNAQQFIDNGQAAWINPDVTLIDPQIGSRNFSPGDLFTYSITLTYNYMPLGQAVPEPSTWAMMLLGFAGIGVVARRSPKVRLGRHAGGHRDA